MRQILAVFFNYLILKIFTIEPSYESLQPVYLSKDSYLFKEAAKKVIFLVAMATKALNNPPPPPRA